jgi:hypothetical protein
MPKKLKDNIGATSYVAQISEADISYTDNQKALFTIPDGAKIYSVSIVATTGFNGTTPTYDLGCAADPDEILDGLTLPSTATNTTGTTPTATANKWANGITSGKIIGTFAGGGTNTAGAGKLRIAYYTP